MRRLQPILVVFIICVSQSAYADRRAPPEVPPLTVNGVQYSLSGGWLADGSQASICVRAVDLKSGKPLWETKLYEIKLNPVIESDVQDICVNSMRAIDGRLNISNEAGISSKSTCRREICSRGEGRVYYDDADLDHGKYSFVPLLFSVAALAILCVLLSWSAKGDRDSTVGVRR
jgi:hypothetical protein